MKMNAKRHCDSDEDMFRIDCKAVSLREACDRAFAPSTFQSGHTKMRFPFSRKNRD